MTDPVDATASTPPAGPFSPPTDVADRDAGDMRNFHPAASQTSISAGVDLVTTLSAHFANEFADEVPADEIVKTVTTRYLELLDPLNPPKPTAVKNGLLQMTNMFIGLDNEKRGDRTTRTNKLKALTNYQVAQVLLHLHRVVRIAPSNQDTDRDYDLLAMYTTSGPDLGIYTISQDAIRAIARLYNTDLSLNGFTEVVAILREDSERTHVCQDGDLIAVNNGIFDYRTKTLSDFSPQHIFLSKSRVNYVAGAANPVITHPVDGTVWDVESWMSELSDDPEIVDLLWEILGAILRPHVRWNKAAFFYATGGNNGKGTLCALMRNLLGNGSHASISLDDLGKDFALEGLVRANAIIVDENEVDVFIEKAANLKAIITNDVIQINRKNRPMIAHQHWGFMVQCINGFPRLRDKSDSLYRRQLFIAFEKNFTGVERRYIKGDYLQRPEVLEYVMHRVLHMDYHELSEPVATKVVLAQFKEYNDPVRDFFNEFKDRFVWDLLPFTFLYDLYLVWSAQTNPKGSPFSQKKFISDLVGILDKETDWYCPDQTAKHRPSGHRMAAPETLIAEYDLKRWMSPLYTGSDPVRISQPALQANYRGVLRTTPRGGNGPGPSGAAVAGDMHAAGRDDGESA